MGREKEPFIKNPPTESERVRDIAAFNKGGKGEANTFLDALDKYAEEAISMVGRMSKQDKSYPLRATDENGVEIGRFVPDPSRRHRHIFFLNNGEVGVSKPADPASVKKYDGTLSVGRHFPQIDVPKDGRVTDETVLRMKDILSELGVHVANHTFVNRVNRDYAEAREAQRGVGMIEQMLQHPDDRTLDIILEDRHAHGEEGQKEREAHLSHTEEPQVPDVLGGGIDPDSSQNFLGIGGGREEDPPQQEGPRKSGPSR